MYLRGRRLDRFMERTGALAACGYKKDVDWMRTAAFEIVLLGGLQWKPSPGLASTPSNDAK